MIPLLLILSLGASDYKCALDDARCWRTAALNQEERAERAEARLDLERSMREVTERMVKEERERGDRWKKTAMEVAPKAPAFYETPMFWGSVGVAVGVVATVAVAFAVKPATR